MPVAARSTVVVAFPAARIRRLPARPAPAQAPAFATRRGAQAGVRAPSGHGARLAGVAAVLLALSGAAGWGFVAAERGVQASLAGYATSSASAAGVASVEDGRAVSSSAWDRR